MSDDKIVFDSLFVSPKQDQFRILLPFTMFQCPIVKRYDDVVKYANMHIDNINDFVHATIASVTPPNQTLTLPTQYIQIANNKKLVDNSVTSVGFMDQRNLQEVVESKILTVTFSHVDSYLTYFLFNEFQLWYKDPNNSKDGVIGDIILQFYTVGKYPLFKTILKRCKIVGKSELELSYQNVVQDYKTFDVMFDFETMESIINIPKKINKT